jgi:hypothetical protein
VRSSASGRVGAGRYAYRNADTLLEDFWGEVAAILKKEGIE